MTVFKSSNILMNMLSKSKPERKANKKNFIYELLYVEVYIQDKRMMRERRTATQRAETTKYGLADDPCTR